MANARLVIFEDEGFENLLPLVYCRPVFELRCGCRTLRQRIMDTHQIGNPTLFCRDYLQEVATENNIGTVTSHLDDSQPTLFVNGRALLLEPIPPASSNLIGMAGDTIAYIWADGSLAAQLSDADFLNPQALRKKCADIPTRPADITMIRYPWDLIQQNETALETDWHQVYQHSVILGKLYPGVHLLEQHNIYIDQGSIIKPGCVLDAEAGPIMIGKNVTIRPNCTLEGPLYIGDNSLIQPGSVINEGVSIGPVCKVGGELESSILHSHSNKQHDGFLGHSYIGQWVNLAADTINSDLKNTYGTVRVPINGRDVDSGQMFVGLTMGDHSKTSVNSKFSTGTVIGFACSVFSSHFPLTFVPSFSWLTDAGRCQARPDKAADIAKIVMARRKIDMTPAMRNLFIKIPELSRSYEHMDKDHS